MTLSGPNACLGSMKEAKILLHFLHSAMSHGSVQGRISGSISYLHAIDDGSGLCIPIGILNCCSFGEIVKFI